MRPRPAENEAPTQDRGAEGARKMMAANAPVETGQTQGSPPTLQGRDVNPQPMAESFALLRERQLLFVSSQETLLPEAVEDEHAQLTSKMVVTHPGLPKRRVKRTRVDLYRADTMGQPHEVFDHGTDVVIGQPEVPVPTNALHGREPRIDKLGQV